MKKFIFLIICLFISICVAYSVTYDTYVPNTEFQYIPFRSTSPTLQNVNYNTVKPLNEDGTVSVEYTTYRGVYRPRRDSGLGGTDEDPIGGLDDVPVGDSDIYLITLLLFSYLGYRYLKNRKSQMLLLNIQKH